MLCGSPLNPLTDQVKRLLAALGPTEKAGAEESMRRLKLRYRPTFRGNDLRLALNAGLIVLTEPDSPTSPTQRYRRDYIQHSLT